MAKGKEFLTNLIISGKVSPELAKAINKANAQSKALNKIGNAGKAIAKATLAVGTATAAGVIAIAKSAVQQYAEYEQLVGGVDTLFKESSKTVQQYANNAYKTAGLSANEYMSTVTSFSASMIASLGGDTKKAAEYANQAITDMSDNANKMGTDMATIQQAYQSMARGNYGMLDSLKIGYGGTKKEMERLLADASKISGIKYDISSFSDITQAIHVVQTEMGITGTTAKEASTTIQGSLMATKAAYKNLITGLGNENADFDALLTNFLDSVGVAASNLLPKIAMILSKIPDLIRQLIPMIPSLIGEFLPVVINGVSSIIAGVAEILPELVVTIVKTIGQIITQSFMEMPTPMKIIAVAIGAIAAGIAAYNAVIAIKNVMDKVQEKGIKNIAKAQIAQNAAFLASPIFWIVAAIVALIAIIAVCVKYWDKIKEAVSKAWEAMKNAFANAGQWFYDTVIAPVVNLFSNMWNGLVNGAKSAWLAVKSVFSTVASFFGSIFSAAWSAVKSVFSAGGKIFDGIKDGIVTAFKTVVNAIITGINKVVALPFDGLNGILNRIQKIKIVGIKPFGWLKWRAPVPQIPHLATGDTFDGRHPQLAVVGDAAETMVPHGNTPRNRALLAEAARGVGGGALSNVTITFAPVIYGGNGADIRQAINDSEIEFERKMDAYFARKGRVSFA